LKARHLAELGQHSQGVQQVVCPSLHVSRGEPAPAGNRRGAFSQAVAAAARLAELMHSSPA
jgi:hypothetical protein